MHPNCIHITICSAIHSPTSPIVSLLVFCTEDDFWSNNTVMCEKAELPYCGRIPATGAISSSLEKCC